MGVSTTERITIREIGLGTPYPEPVSLIGVSSLSRNRLLSFGACLARSGD